MMSTETKDIIDVLAGIEPGSSLSGIRGRRLQARENAQISYLALFEPVDFGDVAALERYAVAAFVAGVHGEPAAAGFYLSKLAKIADKAADRSELVEALQAEIERAKTSGPYGAFPAGPLSVGDKAGLIYRVAPDAQRVLPSARRYARCDAGAAGGRLVEHGDRHIVPTGRVPVVSGSHRRRPAHAWCVARTARGRSRQGQLRSQRIMSDSIVVQDSANQPVVFTQAELGWLPWLEPLAEAELTERHWASLVDRSRAKSAYFRLLARDPEILEARTKTDKDIFYNTVDGLPRAERELAAAATSRYNGCIYCASVHARFATVHSKRRDDVQRLLDEGVGADLGERWNAIVSASVALASTPIAFGAEHVEELRRVGLDDAEIVDVINSAAFFNWANRLMLSLGEPTTVVAK
jgi:alkylhydroperoxidase domain protein